MLTRREYLKYAALAGGTLALQPSLLKAFESSDLITRAIPSTGEKLPIVGLEARQLSHQFLAVKM